MVTSSLGSVIRDDEQETTDVTANFAGAAERLERLARKLEPVFLAFVGKAAYEGAFREQPRHGLQDRRLANTRLFVLPSTSPANAAMPYEERLHPFRELAKTREQKP
jgi:double-stranded uracil-DNA glycosylase